MHLRTFSYCCIFLILSSQALCQQIIISNVNLVDVVKGVTVPESNIFIEGNQIVKVSKGKLTLPAGATVVDGQNKFLIPGLWDMHTHTWNREQFFPLLLVNGVTGIRDMFTMSWKMVEGWKKDITESKYPGPVIYGSGPIVDGPKPVWPGSVAVNDASQGKNAVDSLKNKLHVDFIKVYSLLPREAYFAIAEESKKQGIPFAGHVPNQVSVLEAAAAGQKSLEHMYGLLLMASDSADYLMQVVQGKIKDPMLDNRTNRLKMMLRTYNQQKFEQGLKQLASHHTWICPTLTVNRSIAYLNDSNFVKDERLAYMGSFMRDFWNPKKDFRFKDQPAEYFEISKLDYQMKLRMLPLLQKHKVLLLAGTDYPNPYCFPGFSLHDELTLMTEAGLSAAQALQTATINPALYLGIEAKYGSIEKGKVANLVLLDANPLENIQNTKKINAVILNGKLFNRLQLDQMLQTVKDIFGK